MKRNLFALLSLLVLGSMIMAACGGGAPAATQASATQAPATQAATQPPAGQAGPYDSVKEEPFAPTKVEAPNCDYGGEMKTIEAVDEFTVKFTLCYPDGAFLSKVAFSSFGIQPKEILKFTGGTGKLLEAPVGTGPYMVESWDRGNQLVFKRFDGYWGDKAKSAKLVFRWSTEAAQRLLELQSGTVDAIDNVGPDDFKTVEGDSSLKLIKRDPLNVFYVAFTNTFPPFDKVEVRQAIAMGIDKKRIVDNFYPAGSTVADYFAPCGIANSCIGDKFWDFDPKAAKELLAKAGFPDGFKTKLYYRDVVRGYLPQASNVAQDIQAQLKTNLNIDAEIVVMESGAFIPAANGGELDGIHLLGWGADYPDQSDFLSYFFGAGGPKEFGTKFNDLVDVLKKGDTTAGDAARAPFYQEANNLLKKYVPMVPIAHGASAMAYKATVEGAHASPLTNELFYVVGIPGQDTFVFMQNAEPISLYCGDESDGESLRACEQAVESLYAYKVGGTDVVPSLAESCDPNADSTEWTCHLRKGVKFHNGFGLDAADVVESYAVQWDASNPAHKGNSGAFDYWSGLWGGFINAKK